MDQLIQFDLYRFSILWIVIDFYLVHVRRITMCFTSGFTLSLALGFTHGFEKLPMHINV